MYLYILLLLISTVDCQLLPPEDRLSDEMKAYIRLTKVNLSNVYDTIGLINTNEEYTSGILDHFLKYKNIDAVLIGNRFGKFNKFGFLEKTPNLFCFVNTVDHFEVTMAYIKENPFFKMDGFIQFIVGKAVNNKDWLHKTLDYIWSNDILNFVIVFQIQKTVEVIGFNPFTHSYYNFTNHKKGAKIYPDKLHDVHGYIFQVAMMHDYPRNIVINGQLEGIDVNRLRYICSAINATCNITMYNSFVEITEAISTRKANFSFIRHTLIPTNRAIFSPTYPIQFDYMIFVVPSATQIPYFFYLFAVFEKYIWTAIFASFIAIGIFAIFFIRKFLKMGEDISYLLLVLWQMSLNNSYWYVISGKNWSLKLFYLFWVYYSLVITTLFSASLRSSLINPKYNAEIQSIEDLYDSGLPVAINAYLMQNNMHSLEKIKNQVINMSLDGFTLQKMVRSNKSMAYCVLSSFVQKILDIKGLEGRFYYRIIPEYIFSVFTVYNFPHNSPFLRKFEELFLLDRQYDLSAFGIPSLFDDEIHDEYKEEVIPLRIEHLESAFYVFGIGLFLSLIIFIMESLVYKLGGKI